MLLIKRARGLARRLVPAVRRAGHQLRWRTTWAISPGGDRLAPPPWKLAAVPQSARLVARYDAPPEPIVRPLVYGATPQPADLVALPQQTADRPLSLTCYRDVAMLGRRLFLSRPEGTVLPYSFHATRDRDIPSSDIGLGHSPPGLGHRIERVSGPIFAPDVRFDEFGHVLLETIPALALLGDAPADAVVATSATVDRSLLVMGEALGVAPERWRQVRQPLLCDELYLPDLPIQIYRHIHPIGREALDRLGRLSKRAGLSSGPERIFLSRSRIPRRRLLNEAEIEAEFARQGFTIIHPETLPIESQIALMQSARLVAGAAGTAMHLMAFAPPEARVLILSSPVWFTTIDIHLNPRVGRLGYVFGVSEPVADRRRFVAPWSIDAAEVKAAIRAHFDI
jgi:hypothetical protein